MHNDIMPASIEEISKAVDPYLTELTPLISEAGLPVLERLCEVLQVVYLKGYANGYNTSSTKTKVKKMIRMRDFFSGAIVRVNDKP